MTNISLVIAAVFFFTSFGVNGKATEPVITADDFVEDAPGVFVRFGSHKEISKDSVAAIANHGFIVGETSVAVIDPGGSLSAAEHTLQIIDTLVGLPVSHVVVTHLHPDHSLGLAAYNKITNVTILGHPKLTGSLLANIDFFKQNFIDKSDLSELLELLGSNRIEPATTNTKIDLGNRNLTLTSFNTAHTATDVTVFDHQQKLLWAGDLLFAQRLPSLDGSLPGWQKALQALDKFDIAHVIPGHGNSGTWDTTAAPQRQYLSALLQDTRNAIKKGQSLRVYVDSSTTVASPRQWLLYRNQHIRNTSRAFTELEWE